MKRYETETYGDRLIIRFYRAPARVITDALKVWGYKYYRPARSWVGTRHKEDVLDALKIWDDRCEKQRVKVNGETLCVSCALSGYGNVSDCCWERDFEPVEGWKAIRQDVRVSAEEYLESYLVLACPQYEPEVRRKTCRNG